MRDLDCNSLEQTPELDGVRHVLVASQDHVFGRRMTEALHRRGLGGETSPRTLPLLQRLSEKKRRPDLLLLDISDNQATGMVLHEVLRFEAWDLPVVVVRSAGQKRALLDHVDAGRPEDVTPVRARRSLCGAGVR